MTDSREADASADRDRTSLGRSSLLRWLLLLSPLAVPWVVVRTTETTLLFAWGLLRPATGHVVTLPDYLGRTLLPPHLESWPVAVACYGAALAWAAGRRAGADQRVTAGLLALAAIPTIQVASGLAVDPATDAIPLGSVHAGALAVWVYLGATRDPEESAGNGR